MRKINLRKLDYVVKALSDEAVRVERLRVRIGQILEEGRRNRVPEGEEWSSFSIVFSNLSEAADILEKEADFFNQAAERLERIILLYRRSEKRIIEIYQGEYRILPRTRFGRSDFENLQLYEGILPFRKEERGRRIDQTMTDVDHDVTGASQELKKIL